MKTVNEMVSRNVTVRDVAARVEECCAVGEYTPVPQPVPPYGAKKSRDLLVELSNTLGGDSDWVLQSVRRLVDTSGVPGVVAFVKEIEGELQRAQKMRYTIAERIQKFAAEMEV